MARIFAPARGAREKRKTIVRNFGARVSWTFSITPYFGGAGLGGGGGFRNGVCFIGIAIDPVVGVGSARVEPEWVDVPVSSGEGGGGGAANVTVTVVSALIVTAHVEPLPEQPPPLHPVRTCPAPG